MGTPSFVLPFPGRCNDITLALPTQQGQGRPGQTPARGGAGGPRGRQWKTVQRRVPHFKLAFAGPELSKEAARALEKKSTYFWFYK